MRKKLRSTVSVERQQEEEQYPEKFYYSNTITMLKIKSNNIWKFQVTIRNKLSNRKLAKFNNPIFSMNSFSLILLL